MRRRALALCFTLCVPLMLSPDPAAARRQRLDLQFTSVDLPGAPATILSPDLNSDGHPDLVVMVAFTEWDQLAIEEMVSMDDIDGLVEAMTIVPALTDRREVHLFLGDGLGDYHAAAVLPLGDDILALEPGPPGAPVIALTDEGLAALRWHDDPADPRLEFETLVNDPPIFAGSRTFVPRLGISHDLDNDQQLDILLPADDGAAIYLGSPQGLQATPTQRFALPTDHRRTGGRPLRSFPLPRVEDVTGDGLLDLVIRSRPGADHDDEDGLAFYVFKNLGGGHFAEASKALAFPDPCPEDEEKDDDEDQDEDCPARDIELAYYGDLDGDGRAEFVTQLELEAEGDGIRQELRHAKRPTFRYQLFHSADDLRPEAEPYATFEALGYTFDASENDGDDEGFSIPGGHRDLDGDGRQDLITLTLDFSMMQIMRVMTTRRLSLGLDFHIYCQADDGRFQAVSGLDLSGKFKIDLDDVQVRQLSFFDGDFDGDGKADFVQLGRGRTVTIHRGQDGCRYATKPDLILKLDEEPRNVALVRIEDFDSDGFSDLLIVQPNRIDEPGVTPPVRLDLYLSHQGGGR